MNPIVSQIVFGIIAAMFGLMAIHALWHLQWARRLPSLTELESARPTSPTLGAKLPRVSVVVAARDEAVRVEATVRRLLTQRGVELEIIVVDDRSRDGRAEMRRRVAKEDRRVRVLRVETLPNGWLGKCHACHIGAAAASGEWILFLDADCWLKDDVLQRALIIAAREAAGHI